MGNSNEYMADYTLERRTKKKEEWIAKKGGACQVCGIKYDGKNRPIFDFHHLENKDSKYAPGVLFQFASDKRLESELETCIIVCANCHRLIHYGIVKVGEMP